MTTAAWAFFLALGLKAGAGEVQFLRYDGLPPNKHATKASEAAWGDGFAAMKAEDWPKCERSFEKAAKLEKLQIYKATAMYNQAVCLGRARKREKSAELLKKAVKLEPSLKRPAALELSTQAVQDAMAAIDQGNHEEAEKLLNAAIEKNSANAVAHSELAFLNARKGKYEECRRSAAKSIESDAKYVNPLVTRAGCSMHLDRLPDALKDLDTALGMDPANQGALINRAMLHAKMGQCGLATADAKKAISLSASVQRYFERPVNGCAFGK